MILKALSGARFSGYSDGGVGKVAVIKVVRVTWGRMVVAKVMMVVASGN